MKSLKFGLVALVLLVLATPAIAKVEVTGDAYVNYSSMYLWRGFDLSDGHAVAQGGMDISFKGLTLSYWSNYNFTNSVLDETDITVDYSFDAGEMVGISLGHILYSVQGFDDIGEVYAGVSLNTLLSPALKVYYDYDNEATYVAASIGHSLDLKEGLSLSLGALASYVDNDAYSDLHNAEFSAGLDYAVTDQISLSPAVVYSLPISDDAEDIGGLDDELMGGLTLTFSF